MSDDSGSSKAKTRITILALLVVLVSVGLVFVVNHMRRTQDRIVEMRECTGICTDAPASTEEMHRKKAVPAPTH